MFTTALPFPAMPQTRPGMTRVTFEIPADMHEAFLRKCFLAKPRTTMRHRFIEFLAKETGLPMPTLIDHRKLPRKQPPSRGK